MLYPEEFIASVKELYPKDAYLHELLSLPADTRVGAILRKSIMLLPHLLTPLDKMHYSHVLSEGESIMQRLALYQRWVDIYYNSPGNMHVRRGGEHLKHLKPK